MDPLYFLHIPKCGGTSIRKKLSECFGDRMCPALVWDDFYRHPEWRSTPYDAYCGHFGSDLSDFLGIPLRTFTLLRDPVSRTVSHYYEIRRSRNHPLHGVVMGQTLMGYLTSPVTVPLSWNLQARYLSKTLISIDHLAKIFKPDRRYTLMAGWERVGCYTEPSAQWQASHLTLESMDFIATTDTLDAAFPVLAERYGFSPEPCRENTASHPEADLDENTIQRIRDLTEIDHELLESVSLLEQA